MSDVPVGVIIPPVDVRALICKTAVYVNKNGVMFENKIRIKESDNPKFIFLNSDDPYNGYYKYVLETIKNTGTPPVIEQTEKSSIDSKDVEDKVIDQKNAKEPLTEPKGFECLQIENGEFIGLEDKISKVDLQVIKLIAQFGVINGSTVLNNFKNTVLNHPRLSPQFQFLRDNHSMNKMYKKYFNVYELIWNKRKKGSDALNDNESMTDLLNRCFNSAEYYEKESNDLSKIQQIKLMKRRLYESIDWQDFEIVETIDFNDLDDVSELNRPLNKSDLEYRSLVQKEELSLFNQLEEQEQTSDFEEGNANHEEAEEDNEEKDDGKIPQYDEEDSDEEKGSDGAGSDHSRKEALEEDKEDAKNDSAKRRIPAGLKVKAAGESRLLKRKYQQMNSNEILIDPVSKEKLLRCPLTDKLVPESKFQNHINTLLRDPKYEEEKARYESKFKFGSNLSTSQVYENIQTLFKDNKRAKQ